MDVRYPIFEQPAHAVIVSTNPKQRLQVFSRLAPSACFPALGTECVFPALGNSCMFSRAWHRVRVSRAWQQLHVFPRLAPSAYFPRLAPGACFTALDTAFVFFPALQGTGCMFSCAWHRFHVNAARLAPVASFAVLGSSIVSRGTSYEALQVSKAIIKSQKFMLKGPQLCKIPCFTSNN